MKHHLDNCVLAIIVVLIAISMLFLLLPVIVSAGMSFDARSYLGPFPPPALSLQWYDAFFSENYYLEGLRTSVVIAIVAAVLSTVVGATAALALDRYSFPGKDVLSALFLSPLIVPAVVIGFALLVFFSVTGLHDAFIRLLAGHVIITVPYTIRTTIASLAGIRKTMVEAALSLGANERQAFWSVTFPLARTGIVAGALFAFAFSLDDVAVSMFLSDPNDYTLPVALISMMRANFDLTIAAAAMMLIGFTLFLIFALDRLVGLDRVIGQGIYRA